MTELDLNSDLFDAHLGYVETETIHMSASEQRTALKYSPEYFINFFMGDKIEFGVPEFHTTVFSTMTSMEILRFACAIPRDHAKTTLAKLAVVWHFLFSRVRFCVYVSAVLPNAVNAVNDIVNFMQSDNFIALFGKPEFTVYQDGKGFYKFRLRLRDPNGKVIDKTCILRAFSTNQKIRGLNVDNKRPDLAILDDIEDDDIIGNEAIYNRAKLWLYGSFRKALDKLWHKIIHIGNMIANVCMLNDHLTSKFWHSMHFGCLLQNGQPLWPDAWPLEKLKLNFQEYAENGQISVWFAEMMNLPLAGRGVIREEDITMEPQLLPGTGEFGFLTLDPAISEEKWACKAAVAAHIWNGRNWQIAEYYVDVGIDPIQMFSVLVQLAIRWNIRMVGIESNAFQATLKPVFEYLALLNNLENDLSFVPLYAEKRKSQRIATWAGLLKKGEWSLNEGDFYAVNQLLEYDPQKKRNEIDLIDACAHGPQMLDMYMVEIMDSVRDDVIEQKPQGLAQLQGTL